MTKYRYYDYDNAIYRKRNQDLPWISEVKTPEGKWVKYEGDDALAPVFYGSEISAKEAGEKD